MSENTRPEDAAPETGAEDAAGPEAAAVNPETSARYAEIIGAAFWLSARSEAHRAQALGVTADVVLAGVELRQFRLWRQEGAPLAFVVWGMLDDDAERKFREGAPLTAEEMSSGSNAWIMTLISPFLPQDVLLKDLRENQFAGQTLMALI